MWEESAGGGGLFLKENVPLPLHHPVAVPEISIARIAARRNFDLLPTFAANGSLRNILAG